MKSRMRNNEECSEVKSLAVEYVFRVYSKGLCSQNDLDCPSEYKIFEVDSNGATMKALFAEDSR